MTELLVALRNVEGALRPWEARDFEEIGAFGPCMRADLGLVLGQRHLDLAKGFVEVDEVSVLLPQHGLDQGLLTLVEEVVRVNDAVDPSLGWWGLGWVLSQEFFTGLCLPIVVQIIIVIWNDFGQPRARVRLVEMERCYSAVTSILCFRIYLR